MADNVTLPGTGAVVAADEVTDGTLGTVEVQFVKLMGGALNDTTKVEASTTAPTTGQGGMITRPLLYGADGNPINLPADRAADSGNSLKIGGLVNLNSAALPTAGAGGNRYSAMVDEYGRLRIVLNRPKLLGGYKFESGRLTALASAHASTAGFLWLINPVGSGVVAYVKKWIVTAMPTAVTAFASSPRVTIERVTFTGSATGATITAGKRDSNDATPACKIITASTGLTLTAGAVMGDFSVPAILTAAGIAVPVEQYLYDSTDDDDYIVLRAGEGLVLRQADAGTTSDTRLVTCFASWEER